MSASFEDDELKQVTSLRKVIDLYAERFQTVVAAQRKLGFNKNDGEGKLRKAADAVEERFAELTEPGLTNLMQMMRADERDFILLSEDQYGVRLVDRTPEFETALARANLPSDATSQILDLIRK